MARTPWIISIMPNRREARQGRLQAWDARRRASADSA